ncbi:MAG: nicotinamide mononucleotide transporter [Clostridia bacterium]|nr:nicotinamide mononucleotide transporter [Clostridia bacterium]
MKLKEIKRLISENKFSFILISVTMVILTVATVVFKQSVFRVFPLYISLVIGMLQAKANRYAPLLGGINSVFYALIYFYYKLYASAAYAILFSCPVQLITFIRWQRNAYESSTVFKKMSPRLIIAVAAAFTVSWVGMMLLLGKTDSGYVLLDTFTTVLGVVTTFLTLFAFREYTVTMLVGVTASIALYIMMIFDTPEQVTYLIYGVYTFICCVRGYINVRRLYRRQCEEKTA